MSSIIRTVITKARKSGGRPTNRTEIELKLTPGRKVLRKDNSSSAKEEVRRNT